MSWYGWSGTILKVDMTNGKIAKEPLQKDFARKYVGGSGMGSRFLYDMVPPEVKPFDSENMVIVAAGPLCGTLAPGNGRVELIAKSPHTGIYGDSNGGGSFTPSLKWAGYDLIIVKGKSKKPMYLWIDDDHVELRDAGHIWGKDTWTTHRIIVEELGDPGIQTGIIGPAGENQCFSANVIFTMARATGKTAIGAVLGSKMLKAIAVRGTKGVKISKPEEFMKVCKELCERVKEDPLYEGHSSGGTPWWVSDNFMKAPQYQVPGVDRLLSTEINKYAVKNLACFGCPLHCSHHHVIMSGKYAGTSGEGVEGNSVIWGGFEPKIYNPSFIIKYHILCNKLGLNLDQPGVAISWAMKLYELGVITKKDTDGIELTYGNEDAFLEMVHKIAYKDGFGEVLDGFPLRAAERIGKPEAWISATHGKGLYWLHNDSGVTTSLVWTLGRHVATRGVDHLKNSPGTSSYILGAAALEKEGQRRYGDPEVFLKAWPQSIDRIDRQARFVYDKENLMYLCDMTGICKFWSECCMFVEGIHLPDFARLLSTATGVNYAEKDLVEAAERTNALQRAYNAREGIRRIDDYPHAFRWLKEKGEPWPGLEAQPPKLPTDLATYDKMLDAYLKHRGCDAKTGISTKETLERLGLGDVAKDLTKRGILEAKKEGRKK